MLSDNGAETISIDAKCDTPTPLSARSTNVPDRPREATKKRKLSRISPDGSELGESISIHPCSAGNQSPKILKPRRLINRSALPLACLSATLSSGAGEGLPLFSSFIWVLERDGSGEEEEVKILIAESLEDRRLFAIEKVERGVYVLCGLAQWVSLGDISRKAIKKARFNACKSTIDPKRGAWWAAASIDKLRPQSVECFPIRRSLLGLSMKPRPNVTAERIAPTIIPQEVRTSGVDVTKQHSELHIEQTINTQPHAIGDVRKQYLDALYVSKAPLAYFVKGPLSRARVEHQSTGLAMSERPNLLEILRSSILPVKGKGNSAKIDKKYATSIPELVKEIPPGSTADDEGQLKSIFGDKSRKSRKRKKINPDGFFPGEEDYIVKWWIDRENTTTNGSADDTQEKRIRTACSCQKPREMQLQVVLILEILALELQELNEGSKSLAEATQPADLTSQGIIREDKKSTDYSKILDILLEKLQIWETTNQEILDLGKGDTSAASTIKNKSSRMNVGSDCLRSFCTEVIMPFYAPRLPDMARSICQKLGAAIPSPPRKSLARSVSSSKLATKPGAPVRVRRPLARVFTEDNAIARKPSPALSRSATDSSLPVIKQEFEDETFASASLRRQNLQQTRRYTQREVDLAAEAKATEAKLKRKNAIEQEIKGAIDTLKRPNARLAVREFVEASDQRHTTGKGSKSRKSQNPTYNPFGTGVQVMATPKANRYRRPTRKLANIQPELHQVLEAPEQEQEAIPPSSDPRIPSSSYPKPSHGPIPKHKHFMASSTPQRPSSISISHAIQATPSRPRTAHYHTQPTASALSSLLEVNDNNNELEYDSLPTTSPDLPKLPKLKRAATINSGLGSLKATEAFIRPGLPFATPAKARPKTSNSLRPGLGTGESIFATPVKAQALATMARVMGDVVADSSPPMGKSVAGGEGSRLGGAEIELAEEKEREQEQGQGQGEEVGRSEPSIYAALGWDDEGAVDLL